jgi:hypothetical protein
LVNLAAAASDKGSGEDVLRGNNLRVYLLLLKHGEDELGEVQRELVFSDGASLGFNVTAVKTVRPELQIT